MGIAKALKVVLETIRDWRQKREQQRIATDIKREERKQQEHKTVQEAERARQARHETIAKRISNAKEFMALHDQIKSLPREDQKRILKMIAFEIEELDKSSVEVLPE